MIRALRIYHGGRELEHRKRDRALAASAVHLNLVVPSAWDAAHTTIAESECGVRVIELEVRRPGDVNRHKYLDQADLSRVIADVQPDVLDIHEEPYSVAARQWLAAAPPELPVVMYTAQNIDKRLPPPFARYEQQAHRRVAALYPCSAQAASVARGKGFSGHIEVLPLGYDETVFRSGSQQAAPEIVLSLVGRLVPEKGVLDAVRVLAAANATRPSRLLVVGQGPEERTALDLAASLNIGDRLEILPWQPAEQLAAIYRRTHVVLVPSRPTETWVEQFGRVIIEAQASGAVVAGYRSGSIPEVGGDAAVLVEVGDLDGLVREVTSLMHDPAAFDHRRAQGLQQTRPLAWSAVGRRQADLYGRAVAGEFEQTRLPRSPLRRRALARTEFGPTADALGGERPFALPVLRRGGTLATGLAALVDSIAESAARVGPGR